MNQLLNVGEAASLLRLSRHTLYRWVFKGRVPTVRLGRRLLFDPDALRAWVLERSRAAAMATPSRPHSHSGAEQSVSGPGPDSATTKCRSGREFMP